MAALTLNVRPDHEGVNVTVVPTGNVAVHVAPQLMPLGEDVTVPKPDFVTVSRNTAPEGGGETAANVAPTATVLVSVTTQVPVPLHPAPLQPVKADPADGTAVSVTTVPDVKAAPHVDPHEMPAGLDVTVPVPAPVFVTLSVEDVGGGGRGTPAIRGGERGQAEGVVCARALQVESDPRRPGGERPVGHAHHLHAIAIRGNDVPHRRGLQDVAITHTTSRPSSCVQLPSAPFQRTIWR